MASSIGAPFRIPFEALTFERNARGDRRLLGRGAFGAVYAATYAHEQVAVKVLELGHGPLSATDREQLFQEAALQYTLRHDNIVTVLGVAVDDREAPPEYAVVMPRMVSDLHGLLHERASPPLSRRLQLLYEVSGRLGAPLPCDIWLIVPGHHIAGPSSNTHFLSRACGL
jgi:hypothetical protein